MRNRFTYLIAGLLLFLCASVRAEVSQPTGKITFEVTDPSGEPLAYATVMLKGSTGETPYGRPTDEKGIALFTVPVGTYEVHITYIGYTPYTETFSIREGDALYRPLWLEPSSVAIDDVVVTATESKGITSSSMIDRKAMEHLQPSSFSDLLSLLPGGKASAPSLSAPNQIHLREIGIASDDYNTSSLGTSFVVDGAPIRNDGNMQYIPSYDPYFDSKSHANAGMDMRTLSTDEIEHVEIVRGIPSVQYGDLTSGLVKIERKRGYTPWNMRFKADMNSKLYYLGKGFEIPDRELTVNFGIDLLDAKPDPRNTLEDYRRATGSVRLNKLWDRSEKHRITLGINLDYTGSFDNKKIDPEANNGQLNDYRSQYNRFALSGDFELHSRREGFFRSLSMNASIDYSRDRIDRRKFVQITKPTAVSNSLAPGEYDAILLEPSFIGEMTIDGRPLNAFAKAVATFRIDSDASSNTILAGVDWVMDKNLGEGVVYDVARPVFPESSLRPRPYYDIPAQHDLGLFIEDNTTLSFGRYQLDIMAGLRATTMLNLGREYTMRGKFYFDPRLNLRLAFPSFRIWGQTAEFALSGGTGWHTKSPTMDQLYPALRYYDIVQLNYFHSNPDLRRINYVTYVIDPTNYALEAARNFKWEVRADLTLAGNRLSVTYFEEDMKSGFRTTSAYDSYDYKAYDYSGVDHDNLQAPPSLEDMPYTIETRMASTARTTNGSSTFKRGVEFTFSSQRIEALRTRLTVTGAWFHTEYSNSDPIQYFPGKTINFQQVLYVGLYENDTYYIREMANTNFMLDTDIPRLGLGFSFTFQCAWTTKQFNPSGSQLPYAYFGPDGIIHPFTEESLSDPELATLKRYEGTTVSRWTTVPFAMTTNLKVTKRLFKEKVMAAIYVTQMFNYTPSYKVDGITTRRHATPYFGMEINLSL